MPRELPCATCLSCRRRLGSSVSTRGGSYDSAHKRTIIGTLVPACARQRDRAQRVARAGEHDDLAALVRRERARDRRRAFDAPSDGA